jgi:hypothetical protein
MLLFAEDERKECYNLRKRQHNQRNRLSGEPGHQSAGTILHMVCQLSIFVLNRRSYLKGTDIMTSEMFFPPTFSYQSKASSCLPTSNPTLQQQTHSTYTKCTPKRLWSMGLDGLYIKSIYITFYKTGHSMLLLFIPTIHFQLRRLKPTAIHATTNRPPNTIN